MFLYDRKKFGQYGPYDLEVNLLSCQQELDQVVDNER